MNSEVEAAFERLSATVPAETHAMLRTCSAALGVYQLVAESAERHDVEVSLPTAARLDGVVRHDPFLAHITTGYDGDLLEIEPGTPIPVKGVRVAFGTEIYDITVTGSTVEASAKTGIGVLDALTVRAGALLSELSDRISAVETTRGFRA